MCNCLAPHKRRAALCVCMCSEAGGASPSLTVNSTYEGFVCGMKEQESRKLIKADGEWCDNLGEKPVRPHDSDDGGNPHPSKGRLPRGCTSLVCPESHMPPSAVKVSGSCTRGYRAPPGSVNLTIIAFGVYGLTITQESTRSWSFVARLGAWCFISFFMILSEFDRRRC